MVGPTCGLVGWMMLLFRSWAVIVSLGLASPVLFGEGALLGPGAVYDDPKSQSTGWEKQVQSDDGGRRVWVVEAGDSFYNVSRRVGVPAQKLMAWNPKAAQRGSLWVGARLYIDPPGAVAGRGAATPTKSPESRSAVTTVPAGGQVVATPPANPSPAPVKATSQEGPKGAANNVGAASVPTPVVSSVPAAAAVSPVQKAAAPPEHRAPVRAEARAADRPHSAGGREESLVAQREVPPPPVVNVPTPGRVSHPGEDDESVVRELRFIREIIYNPDSVPEINCHVRMVSTLVLPDGEKIINVQAGDTRLWGINPVVGRNIVFIKPILPSKSTNIVITTHVGNMYSFRLTSDMGRAPLYTLRVLPPETEDDFGSAPGVDAAVPGVNPVESVAGGWGGSEEEGVRITAEQVQAAIDQAREEERQRAKDRERSFVESVMKARNDDYKISYNWGTPFRVQNIFDANGVTYIRVILPEGRQPVLYVIDENGKRSLANQQASNLDPNLIIVDQVFRKAILALGKKEATIYNKGLEDSIKRAGKDGI